MTYEERMTRMFDRLLEAVLYDPAVDLDTKRVAFDLRNEAHDIIKLIKAKEDAADPRRNPLPHAGDQVGHTAQQSTGGV